MKKVIVKNLLVFFCACIFVGVFSACTAEEEDYKVYAVNEGRFDLNENEYVTIQIVPADDNSSPDLLRIDNHTEGCLTGGVEFSLAYFNKNKWESILNSTDRPWNMIGIALHAGKTTDIWMFDEDLLSFVKTYNKGKKGRYRLIKEFRLVADPVGYELIGDVNLNAEFEIK